MAIKAVHEFGNWRERNSIYVSQKKIEFTSSTLSLKIEGKDVKDIEIILQP